MKANELMIGDIVSHNGIPVKIELVAGMYSYVVPVKDNLGYLNKGFEVDNDELTPAPITPEILEKNGFTHCVGNGGYYLYADESYSNQTMEILLFHVDSEYNSNQLHIGEVNNPSLVMLHLMSCNYVHELQHALRLCGITKDIII